MPITPMERASLLALATGDRGAALETLLCSYALEDLHDLYAAVDLAQGAVRVDPAGSTSADDLDASADTVLGVTLLLDASLDGDDPSRALNLASGWPVERRAHVEALLDRFSTTVAAAAVRTASALAQ